MAIEKDKFPEEGELVLCTVTQISHTSALMNLDEYDKVGILITAEVAPGRIRNIRDYLSKNKKIVCKVLRVNRAKGNIDLSLRRVSLKEKKEVMERYKKDKDALSILSRVVDKSKLDNVLDKITSEFESLSEFIFAVREDNTLFKKFGMDNESEELLKLIRERIKSKKIILKSNLKLSSTGEKSLTLIKKALAIKKPGVKITYISSPLYLLIVESKEYKEAKNILKQTIDEITDNLHKIGCDMDVENE